MRAQYISIDEQKRRIPGYLPEHAEEFHTASAREADRLFSLALKNHPAKTVILLCGGSASGKTEFCSEYLFDEDAIVYDGTLSSVHGAEVKLHNIRRAKKQAVVIGILPDDLTRAFSAFLHRDRQFSDAHFYRTHAGARSTLLWVAEHYPDVELRLFESTYRRGASLSFDILEFGNRDGFIEYLRSVQYTEKQIISLVTAS
ncbi:MAG: hypothetical protein WCG83_02940 [Candidatus Peregrinibacteria bacterium]